MNEWSNETLEAAHELCAELYILSGSLEAAQTIIFNPVALALARFRAEGVEAFVAEVRKMHDQWQHDHSDRQAMSGGYGNPLLAVDLMKRIEKLARGKQP